MQPTEFYIPDLQSLPNVAQQLIEALNGVRIVLLTGNLGAGKTTLTKAICQQLGISKNQLSSPSFALVNEYQTTQNKLVYHIDLYRIKNLNEALDIGIETYLDSGNWCFIEWPQVISPILSGYNYVQLEMVPNLDQTRQVKLSYPVYPDV